MSATDDLTALLVDTADTTQTHGKCNAVYVGFEPSTDQSAALSAYSALFKVERSCFLLLYLLTQYCTDKKTTVVHVMWCIKSVPSKIPTDSNRVLQSRAAKNKDDA